MMEFDYSPLHDDKIWDDVWAENGCGSYSPRVFCLKHYEYFHCTGSEKYILDSDADPSRQLMFWKRRDMFGVGKEHAVGIREMFIRGLRHQVKGRGIGFTPEYHQPLLCEAKMIKFEELSVSEQERPCSDTRIGLVNGKKRDGVDYIRIVTCPTLAHARELYDEIVEDGGINQNVEFRADWDQERNSNYFRESKVEVRHAFLHAIPLDDSDVPLNFEVQWFQLRVKLSHINDIPSQCYPYRVAVVQYHGDQRLIQIYPYRLFEGGFQRYPLGCLTRTQQWNVLHDQIWGIQMVNEGLPYLDVQVDLSRIVRGKDGTLGRLYLLLGSGDDRNLTSLSLEISGDLSVQNRELDFEGKGMIRSFFGRTKYIYPNALNFGRNGLLFRVDRVPERVDSLLLNYYIDGIATHAWYSVRFVVLQDYSLNEDVRVDIADYLDGNADDIGLHESYILTDQVVDGLSYSVNGSGVGVEIPLMRNCRYRNESDLLIYLCGAGPYGWNSQFIFCYAWVERDYG